MWLALNHSAGMLGRYSYWSPYKLNTPQIIVFDVHCSRGHVEKKLEAKNGLVKDYLKGTMFLISDKKKKVDNVGS